MPLVHLQVDSILRPVHGIRDAQRRAGITPTNHSRHNIQAVKEQSRLNALQKSQQQDERIMAATSSFRSRAAGSGRQTGTQLCLFPNRAPPTSSTRSRVRWSFATECYPATFAAHATTKHTDHVYPPPAGWMSAM